jgi:hypothetical protein
MRTENHPRIILPCAHLGDFLRLLGRYAVLRFDPLHEVDMPINYFPFLHMWR